MTEWYFALPATLLLIALSAFFVIIEFALLAARRNRLEETAETSASSRAALRSLNELTLMLAGAQLGITACTFALGAITKPWVHDALMPGFEAMGIPMAVAEVASFVLALFVVTFLHLVIGEMAPKSWAITHPESAIRLIALPARGFINVFRPLLSWINRIANRLVTATGEEPVNRAAARGYDADTLYMLVEHSRNTGALDDAAATQIAGVIELERATVGQAVDAPGNDPSTLPATATVADVQAAARNSGHLRVLLSDDEWATPRVVHVRDTLRADKTELARTWSRPALTLTDTTPIQEALETMRVAREQLVVIVSATNQQSVRGVLTWDYILDHLWPNIEKELDRAQARRESES
ncbi:CNNM domain-containing protein [Gulosibacter molinativorax]|uniref:HlyC/CorC family transporter n=1 Tax=Gulosibacter molinativorax TaxID=256821 RepID=A0ABT7CB23_9MICO|nr:hemolysin family protein [Gulosibacter molinativorax]MDJ1372401.1 HlyC/CorC family transporter [Gulosibacter molinativorax]QUY61118.1 CBS domain-containing protein [Gulosibacter molinativorax]